MKIGLYFGSFNPIHIGHLIISEYVHNNTSVEQVWFVLSPQNPLKASKTLLNAYDRLHLLKLAIEDNPVFQASDVEFKLPLPSYTIDTLTYLSEKYPQHQFVVIMGSDSFQNINNWKNYELLLREYELIIYERPGFKVDTNVLGKHTLLQGAPLLEISATQIRNQLKMRKSIRYMLPAKVYQEIVENKYYQ
jgi:nicotinate-nucleotide adenylyltransferase